MPFPFRDQIEMLSAIVNAQRLTVCIGSGASIRRLPLLGDLIALAFRNILLTAEARQIFSGYSVTHGFSARLAADGVVTSDPCTLDEFRALTNHATQAKLCGSLVGNYGEVFAALEAVSGTKRALLEYLEFHQFDTPNSDAAHFYIGYLVLEGVIDRLLTTNWDHLVESGLQITSNQPVALVLDLIKDEGSWLNRNQWGRTALAKVHGCSTQFPDNCENIILTAPELQLATADGWRKAAVTEFLNGTVLFCGYSASDYTLMVPLLVLASLRAENLLDNSNFYIAQEGPLNPGARNLIQADPNRQIMMWANDTFTSLYFAYLRQRLQGAISTAEQQRRPERAFPLWEEKTWETVIVKLRDLTNEGLGAFLDKLIGDPGARTYDQAASLLPIHISAVRAIFLTGRVPARGKYQNLQFDSNKDIALLILLAALVDLSLAPGGPSLTLETSYAGLTITEGSGTRRKIIFLYGIYISASYPSLFAYLDDIEDSDGQLPEFEVAVIPCTRYDVPDDAFPATPILAKALHGAARARRRFIRPTVIFATASYDALVETLRTELEL
jgi:hypothetical protein